MGTPRIASGTVIARRYTVETTAGSGGMGVVYRATDNYADVPVALKVLQRGATPRSRCASPPPRSCAPPATAPAPASS